VRSPKTAEGFGLPVVALPTWLFQARQAQSEPHNATPIRAAAMIYFLLLWPFVGLRSRLENKQLAGGA
jgi:polar amino acid transport system permease protein